MIKFNTLYKDNMTYPCKLSELYISLCKQVGLEAGNTNFINNNYMVLGNPFTNNEDCRTVLSNIAQLAGGFAKIGRDNKVYIKSLKNISNLLTVKYVNAMTVKELNLTMVKALSEEKNNADEKIDGNNYFDDFEKNEQWGELNSLVVSLSSIDGENTTVQDKDSIKENGLTEITIQDNSFLINQEEREKTIVPIWNSLKGIKYLPFKTQYYGYPYIDSGDMIYIQDTKDNGYISYVFNHTFKFNGSFSGNINTPAMTKTQTAYKNTLDIKTKFKMAERSIDKINGKIQDLVEEVGDRSEKKTSITQDINGITQSVSEVKTEVKTVDGKADKAQTTADTAKSTAETAKSTADSTNKNLSNNYYTKTQTENKITQTAESTISEVSKTYSTKTETSNAKQEAIKSANSNTDDKLKGYTETSKLGTAIEQNYEHVKVAWNQISDFIQMMIINNNASLAILDKDKKVMMALDKTGQHFYKEDGTEFGEMGVNAIDNQNYISFGVSGEYDKEISDGMAWGITTKSDGKFWPILYLKNFSMGSKNSDSSSGELVLNNCNLVLDGLGTGIQTGDIRIYGDPAGRVLYFHGETDDKYFMQIVSHGAYLSDMQLKYKNEMNILNDLIVTEYEDSKEIMIFDKIKFFRNVAGSNSLKIGDSNGNYCMLVDDGSISCSGNLMAGDYIHGSGDLYIENEISSKIINCWEHIYCNNGVESFSTLEKKKNIKKYEKSGLDEVLNTDIYYFNYKEDENNAKSRVGTIIGEGYNCSKDIISQTGESISDYSMISVAYKAIQEQQEQIEKLQAKDKQKDELIQSLIQRIETLEKEVNK